MVNQIEESTGSPGSFLCDRGAFQLQKRLPADWEAILYLYLYLYFLLPDAEKRLKSSYPVLLRHPVNLHETHIVAYPLIFFP